MREEARAANIGAWYIGSNATSHMTSDQSFFTLLKDTNMTIFLADGSPVEAAGIGEDRLACRITDNRVQTIELKDVLYIPRFDGELLSVQKTTEHGFRVIFKKNTCAMYQGQRVIARADNSGNLFKLMTMEIEASAKVTKVGTCIHLWHRRLGHRDLKAIKEELVIGVKVTACFDETVCEHCIKGKLAQTKFPENKRRAKE